MTYRDVLIHKRRGCSDDATWIPRTEPELIADLRVFTPMGAPRQNRHTMFSRHDGGRIERYHAYRDEIASRVLALIDAGVMRFGDLTAHLGLCFRFPVPPSWPLKRRVEALNWGSYHRQKPDVDNLVKAFLDAVTDEDSDIADVRAIKVWCPEGEQGVQIWRLPRWL